MLFLVLGVALWIAAHSFKRYAPAARAKMGDKAKGPVALGSFVAIALMVVGYRMAEGTAFWDRSAALTGINNLLMLFSIYLFAASGMKTWITSKIRHPQLTGVKVWSFAHLLVNGDLASFILFGGLLGWAVYEVIAINRQTDWVKNTGPFETRKEVIALVAGLVVFAAIAGIHYLLGHPVFG